MEQGRSPQRKRNNSQNAFDSYSQTCLVENPFENPVKNMEERTRRQLKDAVVQNTSAHKVAA